MNIEELYPEIQSVRSELLNHSVYQEVTSMQRLKWFMEDHVFAVWDFMSLVKRLQRELSCIELPWIPKTESARFIDEIVCGEESDINVDGQSMSHLQMYLVAMEEIGADTRKFIRFLESLNSGYRIDFALQSTGSPLYVQSFVNRTMALAHEGKPVQVAADFLFGREDAIPEMFMRLLLAQGIKTSETPTLKYYLQRHIDLNGDEHGPAARKMLGSLAGSNQSHWDLAADAAIQAMQSRIALWDGVIAKFHYLEAIQSSFRTNVCAQVQVNDGLLAAT